MPGTSSMTEPPRKLTHGDYTVGWICSLPETELVAAMAMLDEKHPILPATDPHDSNSYVLGRIGDHNVAIACLPVESTGKASAATVARDMIRSFPAVRFGLMVGVGGGAPYYGIQGNGGSLTMEDQGDSDDSEDSEDDPEYIRDIRLGDVVISLHSKDSDAVVQYDFGKSLQEKEFVHSGGKLNKPPNIVLSAVAHLKAQHELEGHMISQTLTEMVSRYPALATKFQYPGSQKDYLFKSDFVHKAGRKTCKSCRSLDSNLVKRPNRPDNSPRLHYGTIGSADQVMRDAILRDKWARDESIICFEMEAAGLDSFPSLVVRGICDYADSHKNEVWKPYAAATAACYAKELLRVISGQGVMNMDPIKHIETSLREVHSIVKDTSAAVQDLGIEIRQRKVLDKLPYAEGSSFDASNAEHVARCHPKTRVDLRRHILKWAENPSEKCIFWLNGMAGTGKSTISRTIAQCLREKNQLGASFFFKRGKGDCGSATKFFTTICAQLLLHIPALIRYVEKAIDADPYISGKSLREQFAKLILEPLLNLDEQEPSIVIIVIDALDECEGEDDIGAILQLLPQLQRCKSKHLRMFLTSRPELPIRHVFEGGTNHQILMLHELSDTVVKKDIRVFLKHELLKIRRSRKISGEWPGDDALETLVTRAAPLFISAATICRFIGDPKWPPEERLLTLLEDPAATSGSHMDRTYLPVLKQLISGADNTEIKQLKQEFQDIVGVIILLATPLSINALAQLINKPQNKVHSRLDGFYSVLNMPENNGLPVRILHLSFRDYLLKTGESSFRVNPEKTHKKIASHCLRVMNNRLKRNICDLPSYGSQRAGIDSHIIHHQNLTADLAYSCQYWVHHLEQSRCPISKFPILHFLKTHFLHWLEALSLMGILFEAVGMIDMLQTLVTHTNTKISEFLYDARRYILRNSNMASATPLQLYYSALVFSPEQSVVRKIYSDNIPKWICLLPKMEAKWSPNLQTLTGHSGCVKSVAFSPNASVLASGSDDKIRLWDIKTGKKLQTLTGRSKWIQSVAFSPDGSMLASSSYDKTIKLWDVKTGEELKTLTGHSLPVSSVAFSPNGSMLASGSHDETIELWDVKTGNKLQTLTGHSDWLQSVAFSPDGSMLASGSDDKTIKLWDVKIGNELQTLTGHSARVQSVAFSPDGSMLASGSCDKTIRLWDIKTGKQLQTLTGHSGWIQSVAFSPDGSMLASGSFDKTIILWDVKTGNELQTLTGHSAEVQSVAFSPDGSVLASGSYDKTIKLWDVKTGEELKTLTGHSLPVSSVVFSPNGSMLASGSHDETIKLWDVKTGNKLQTLTGHLARIQSVAFSPDGSMLASGSFDNTISLWDVKTGKQLQTLTGHSDWLQSVAFSPNASVLASGSDDKTIKLWDVKIGNELQTLTGHSARVQSVAFSPDGSILASGSYDKTIILWDIKTGKQLQTLTGHSSLVNSDWVGSVVNFSPTDSSPIPVVNRHNNPTQPRLDPQVSLSGNWISIAGENLICIPPEHRQYECSAVKGATMALGYGEGRVLVIGFHVKTY